MIKHAVYACCLFLICSCNDNPSISNSVTEPVNTSTNDHQFGSKSLPDGLSVLTLPGDPAATFNPDIYNRIASANPELQIALDFARGGLLYDKWWITPEGNLPAVLPDELALTHPTWPLDLNPQVTPLNSWRCNECHGWDYRGVDGAYGDLESIHYSGISGFIQATPMIGPSLTDPAQIYEFIHSGITSTGSNHDFGVQIDDEAIYALTRFITTIQANVLDVANVGAPHHFIDDKTKLVFGDQGVGSKLYHLDSGTGGCAVDCHGFDGTSISLQSDTGSNVETYTIADPWRALHKIQFGSVSVDAKMPGLAQYNSPDLDFRSAINVLSYSQAGLLRDASKGGRLFDDWILETGRLAPDIFNYLWDQRDFAFDAPATNEESWRCVSCHSYAYFGQLGFDANLFYLRERPWSDDFVFNKLKFGFTIRMFPDPLVKAAHNYRSYLLDDEIWDLVEFLMNDVTDTYRYINSAWSSYGDSNRGRGIYKGENGESSACINCHGLDGQGDGDPNNPVIDIFSSAWDSPWQTFHRIRFGSPGSNMVGIHQTQDNNSVSLDIEAAADVHSYIQKRVDAATPP